MKLSIILLCIIIGLSGFYVGKKHQAEKDKWRIAACWNQYGDFDSKCISIQLHAITKDSYKSKP